MKQLNEPKLIISRLVLRYPATPLTEPVSPKMRTDRDLLVRMSRPDYAIAIGSRIPLIQRESQSKPIYPKRDDRVEV
jgi:hypothetical protein